MSRFLYHMALRSEWQQGEAEGVYRGSADDRRDGFMHFSTAEQVAESAAKHRAGQKDLLLIVVAEEGVGPWAQAWVSCSIEMPLRETRPIGWVRLSSSTAL